MASRVDSSARNTRVLPEPSWRRLTKTVPVADPRRTHLRVHSVYTKQREMAACRRDRIGKLKKPSGRVPFKFLHPFC